MESSGPGFLLCSFALILFASLPLEARAAPIPATLSDIGFQIGTPGKQMEIEMFGDFQCPDTEVAWDGWFKNFHARYSDKTSIIFHPFPLPYHKNGFDSAQAALVMVDLLNASSLKSRGDDFIKVANQLFSHQNEFQTDKTVNVSQMYVFKNIFAPIANDLGIDQEKFIGHMTNSDKNNEQARVAWKFATSRGVSGTPTYAANGVISDELADWSLNEWEEWFNKGSTQVVAKSKPFLS